MPTKPLARIERKGILTKVEKKIPGVKTEKNETAAPAEDVVANIFFPSVPKEENENENENEILPTELKSVGLSSQNQMSDFTVTDQSLVGLGVGVEITETECVEKNTKTAGKVISPNQERSGDDDEQEDYVFIEHSDPETDDKIAVAVAVDDVHNNVESNPEVEISGDENKPDSDVSVTRTQDEQATETIENCEFIEHSEVIEANDEAADDD